MRLPLIERLQTREYREIAAFQDSVIELLYNASKDVVLHGGTAVWRCYNGRRFSNDIDIYLGLESVVKDLGESLRKKAMEKGIKLDKVKDTGNLVFMGFSLGNTYLKVEINKRKEIAEPVAKRYEMVDGTYMDVVTLSPEELIEEKINAYEDRRFIRDVYDIYVLSDYVTDYKRIRGRVISFIGSMQQPVNENDLDKLIYEGPTPSFKNMKEHIKARFS